MPLAGVDPYGHKRSLGFAGMDRRDRRPGARCRIESVYPMRRDRPRAIRTACSSMPCCMAQRRETWSPPRIARIVAGWTLQSRRWLSDPAAPSGFSHLRGSFVSTRDSRSNVSIRDYLVRGFTTAERTACFLHHYRRLHAGMPGSSPAPNALSKMSRFMKHG